MATTTASPAAVLAAINHVLTQDMPHHAGQRELLGEAAEVIRRLTAAIREHRNQKQDNRCWLDDLTLYSVLGDGVIHDSRLPPKCDFLQSCARYWEQRQAILTSVEPGGMTLAQLQAEVERLRAEVKRMRAEVDGYEGFRVGPLAGV